MKTNTSLVGRFAALLALCFVALITILGSVPAVAQGTTPDVTYTEINKSQFTSLAGEPETVWWASGNTESGSQMKMGYEYNIPTLTASDFGFYWPGGSATHIALHYESGVLSYTKQLVSGQSFLNGSLYMPLNLNEARSFVFGAENTSSMAGDCIVFNNLTVNGVQFPDMTVNIGEFRAGIVEFSDSMPSVFDVQTDVTLHTVNGSWPYQVFKFDFVAQSVPEPASAALCLLGLGSLLFVRNAFGRRP